jgi:hypothetical protein
MLLFFSDIAPYCHMTTVIISVLSHSAPPKSDCFTDWLVEKKNLVKVLYLPCCSSFKFPWRNPSKNYNKKPIWPDRLVYMLSWSNLVCLLILIFHHLAWAIWPILCKHSLYSCHEPLYLWCIHPCRFLNWSTTLRNMMPRVQKYSDVLLSFA